MLMQELRLQEGYLASWVPQGTGYGSKCNCHDPRYLFQICPPEEVRSGPPLLEDLVFSRL